MFFRRFTKGESAPTPVQPSLEATPPTDAPAVAAAKPAAAQALDAAELRRSVDAKSLGFKTTADLEPLGGLIGQDRAIKAIDFGLGIQALDFNIFVLGPPASGKSTAVRAYLESVAAGSERPPDWIYVTDFEDPRRPRALKLPPGRAPALARSLEAALREVAATLPAAFETEDYRARRRAIDEAFRASQDDALEAFEIRAERQNIAVLRTPLGFGMAPMHEGKAVRPEVFSQLPERMRRDVETRIAALEAELEAILANAPEAARVRRQQLAALDEETARHAVEAAFDEVRGAFADLSEVAAFLAAAEKDLVANAALFITPDGRSAAVPGDPALDTRLRRYMANVVVSHGKRLPGAPIVEEMHPTAANLVGRVEHVPHAAGALTDALLIRPGALHRANGGALMLDARRVLASPAAWESLKRALKSGEIRIDPSAAETPGALAMETLEPEPIPLAVKVLLLGEAEEFRKLADSDPDFASLFKVQADFDETITRSKDNDKAYARLVASMAQAHGLKPVEASGVARLIEEAARIAEDREKLSIGVGRIADIVREADFWSGAANRKTTTGEDIACAIEERTRRAGRTREHVLESLERGVVLVDTAGAKVGQINGLSLVERGGFSFGRPARITARVHLGQGRVTDIEREVALGGPLHAKGVMILWGYLAGRYAQDVPLALAATLVFEQSYGPVEGDSASAAELFALLSALADAPLRQDLAVTGSVNQWGEVQAVGGVNEKIEGFFDVCRARGLSGTQGVIIPEANRQNLMLREDVVKAVREKRFAIYAIKTVDEGMALLTGIEPGETGADGRFGPETVNGRIAAKLRAFAERARAYAPGAGAPAAERS